MEIILNGEKEEVKGETSVAGLLRELELNPDIVTVSLNDRVLAKDELETQMLEAADRLDIILFMGGGC